MTSPARETARPGPSLDLAQDAPGAVAPCAETRMGRDGVGAAAHGAEPLGDETHCECGAVFRFDPLIEGETCGGMHRIGWLVCDACGETSVSKRGVAAGGPFKLASSGRSLDADGFRVRAEGSGDPSRLMARLARLPDLEAALRQIAHRAGGDVAIRALALAALGGEP